MSDILVYKDDCAWCFASPNSADGLFICASHKTAFCREHVSRHDARCSTFLQYVRRRRRLQQVKKSAADETTNGTQQRAENGVEKIETTTSGAAQAITASVQQGAEDEFSGSPACKITKLAIGVDGGLPLDANRFETIEKFYLYRDFRNNPDSKEEIPLPFGLCRYSDIRSMILAESAYKKREIDSMASRWDGSQRFITRNANLLQLPPTTTKPSLDKCQVEDCDKRENLWINLTDGAVLCGRKYADGSGGNGHAKAHFERTGYPLVVNLGTLSPDIAEVYSYDRDEDDMVVDPNLDEHLKHFGIDRYSMVKREKTILEKELDFNLNWEYSSIQEDGRTLRPIYGSGFVGIHNLGNSCYVGSFVQCLGQMPFVFGSVEKAKKQILSQLALDNNNSAVNFFENLPVQFIKVIEALQNADYSKDPILFEDDEFEPPENGIRPYDFRLLVGHNHPEFSTKKQQDVEEFAHHLADLTRLYFGPVDNPLLPLNHLAYIKTGHVTNDYYKIQCVLDVVFPIDESMMTFNNQSSESNPAERPRRNLLKQIRHTAEHPETAVMGCAPYLCTFPDYLLIKVNRHAHHHVNNRPVKLSYALEVDDVIDFGFLRHQPFNPDTPVDPSKVVMAGRREYDAQRNNTAAGATANVHQDDLAQRLNALREQLAAMGCEGMYTELAMKTALRMRPTLDAAILCLMDGEADQIASQPNHYHEADVHEQPKQAAVSSNEAKTIFNGKFYDSLEDVTRFIGELKQRDSTNQSTTYELSGIISHIGASTDTGHYIFHGKKENGTWIIYNDEKVAISENPPKEFGYVYLFTRTTSTA